MMEKQAYMTTTGAWAGNWYDGTLAPAVLIPAPAGGRYGWRWDGTAWVEDDGAEAEVEAVLQPPEQRLAAEREAMVCSEAQAMIALGEARWGQVEAAIAAQPWEVRARFKAASWYRTNPLIQQIGAAVLGLTDEQIDDLFRTAMAS